MGNCLKTVRKHPKFSIGNMVNAFERFSNENGSFLVVERFLLGGGGLMSCSSVPWLSLMCTRGPLLCDPAFFFFRAPGSDA